LQSYVEPAAEKHLQDLAVAWNSPSAHQSPLSLEFREILDETLESLRNVHTLLGDNSGISELSVVLSWISTMPEGFLKMLEKKVLEALLLVAHYCTLLKRLQRLWWINGRPESLLRTVLNLLGNGWERWTQWPIDVVLGNNNGAGG